MKNQVYTKARNAALIIAFILSTATASSAEDFTFNIPVKVKNMHPQIKKLYCHCGVYVPGSKHFMGSGYTRVPLKNGAYSGTVTLKFNAKGYDPATAEKWHCHMLFEKDRGLGMNIVELKQKKMVDTTKPVFTDVFGAFKKKKRRPKNLKL
ncbi:MAG: hypothetical protein D3926_05080 [Desulfobacteraceae bacterium]|nr:MAG: hypothetical protein D3926_05080 [Desulfobacteraceae bacterium]